MTRPPAGQLVEEYLSLCERRDLDAASRLLAPDAILVFPGGVRYRTLAEMAAGAATLDALAAPNVYDRLEALGARLQQGLVRAAEQAAVTVTVNRAGSLLTVFFSAGPIFDWATAKRSDTARFGRFFHAMLDRGVYLPPSAYEAWFLSAAHDEEAVSRVLDALPRAAKAAAARV